MVTADALQGSGIPSLVTMNKGKGNFEVVEVSRSRTCPTVMPGASYTPGRWRAQVCLVCEVLPCHAGVVRGSGLHRDAHPGELQGLGHWARSPKFVHAPLLWTMAFPLAMRARCSFNHSFSMHTLRR